VNTLAEIRDVVLRSMDLPHAASDEMLEDVLASLPADGVIVTPDSLAQALPRAFPHLHGKGETQEQARLHAATAILSDLDR
jgi:hypothetical protein